MLCACIHNGQDNHPSVEPLNLVTQPMHKGKVTERQLQAEIMVFADHFVMTFWQAMDQLYRTDLPPERKLAFESSKFLYTSSAISIAGQPSPVASLLDMITFIRLGHKAVENYWVPEVYGLAGQPLLTAYRRLENEVWQLADLVLTGTQKEEVRAIIDRWQDEHHNQWYVSDIHIQGFSSARGRPVHPFNTEAQGLLSSVNQSLLKVDEAMMVADRALFLGERMPRLMMLQSELLVSQVTENSTVQKLVNDFSEFQKTAGEFSKAIESFPEKVSQERQDVIAQLEALLKAERTAWMSTIDSNQKQVQDVVAEMQTTLTLASKTAHDYSMLIASINSLAGNNETSKGSVEDKEDVLYKARQLAESARDAGQEYNRLLNSLERLMSVGQSELYDSNLQNMLAVLAEKEQKLIDRLFLYGVLLIGMALMGSLVVAIAYRYLSGRMFGQS